MTEDDRVELFVYGTLVPNGTYWDEVARWVIDHRPARVAGALFDTGRGYPAARFDPDADGFVEGVVLTLRDPSVIVPRLDAFEGDEYARTDVRTADGDVVATYEWRDPAHGFPLVAGGIWR
jgi:gamma-glutamylcyclotransferase (GGCT)/AIG2-like uncharacterized protein YtfP